MLYIALVAAVGMVDVVRSVVESVRLLGLVFRVGAECAVVRLRLSAAEPLVGLTNCYWWVPLVRLVA